MKGTLFIIPLLLVVIPASVGCTASEGTLADFLGWQSLGGTWRGTLILSDGRTPDFAMTFTEFDGESFHVLVEAWDEDSYINNQADAEYVMDTKRYSFELLPFFGAPFRVEGLIDGSTSNGTVEIDFGAEMITGQYTIDYAP